MPRPKKRNRLTDVLTMRVRRETKERFRILLSDFRLRVLRGELNIFCEGEVRENEFLWFLLDLYEEYIKNRSRNNVVGIV